MAEVVVLGSGNGLPGSRRDTFGLALSCGGRWLLVDCPGGVVHKLARSGIGLCEVAGVFLTHDHVDHVYGLPHLIHARTIAGDTRPVPVYGPEETLTTAASLLQAVGLGSSQYAPIESVPLPQAGKPVQLPTGPDGIALTIVAAEHSRPTLALRAQWEDRAVGISSDTVATDRVAALCREVDLLLHDCGGLHRDRDGFGRHHASAREAGRIAAQARAGSLRLVHLPDATRDQETAWVTEAAEAFGGPVAVAHDGDRYDLSLGTDRSS